MQNKRQVGTLLSLIVTSGVLAVNAAQAQTFYGDRTTFNAAASGLTTETFDGLIGTPGIPQNYPAGTGYGTNAASGISLHNVNFTGQGYDGGYETYILGPINYQNQPADAYEINGTDALVGGRQSLTATFAAGTTAFGTDIGEAQNGGPPITIDANVLLENGLTYNKSLNLTVGQSQFIGFTGSSAISSVTFVDPNGSAQNPFPPYAIYDNFSSNSASPAVPEPGTLSLLGLGLGGVMLAAGRRRRA